MSAVTDTLSSIVHESIGRTEATREEWLQAIDEVFPPQSSTQPLDPHKELDTEWLVSWQLDVDVVDTAAQAATAVWVHNFNRDCSQPSNEECCVFVVTAKATGQSVQVDLSDETNARIFR